MKFPRQFLFAGLLVLNAISLRAADSPLAWPPVTSPTKPWAYNWWMGSAVDKTNLTKELERYAAAGLGGIHIIPIYGAKGFEDKYISYLSPQWMEMLDWTVSEAHRLGLGVDMTTGTGWCFGGPQVTDEDANASVVVKTYELGAGERLTQKFDRKTTQALVAYSYDGKVIDLTDSITTNGEVFFSPPGNWITQIGDTNSKPPKMFTVYAISQKPSGQKVKRPAPGGEGWMLNLIYPAAMDGFLKPYTAAFENYSGAKPRAQYHDSYEYKSDWSPDFFAQFEKRRGYKLQNELPALFSKGDNDHANRVKCDYRQTVSEIMAEESLPKWVDWSHGHGFITREEAHGSPGNWLDLYATADIPETEFFSKHRNILVSKFASSAAHVAGKNLASSESCTWIDEHFHETLGGVKGLMDELFLAGINHVFYHGCCYSPDEAGWPGWHFYAALEMNPRNPIWRDAPALNAYIARVQSVLQSGKSDNDILLYWPISDFWMQPGNELLPQLRVEAQGWFTDQPVGKAAKELWDKGYAFDYVSDAQLKTAKVVDEKVQMPGGNYKVIVVPECKFIPLETFKQLLALAENGAIVIFQNALPADVSGANDLEGQRAWFKGQLAKVQPLLKPVSSDQSLLVPVGAKIGAGLVVVGDPASPALLGLGIRLEPMAFLSELSFVRRAFDGGWNYFIANRSGTNFDGWITLARPAVEFAMLDPMTGAVGIAATRPTAANQTEVHLQLRAGESVVLRAFDHQLVWKDLPPAWNYWQTNGQPLEITGQWNVKFLEGGPTLPADSQITRLASWTTFPDTNCQAFAGTAKYEIAFDADNSKLKTQNSKFFLDLGDVRQSARVKLNGKDYGTLITPPFRVVVDNLKPTGNTLEVEATSVAANRIRDLDRRGVKWKNFRDINMVDINYKPFDASNWPLVDCGLLGPVTLTPVKAE